MPPPAAAAVPAASSAHAGQASNAAGHVASVRDSPEYLTAWELEIWKREQMEAFEVHLQQREAAVMDEIRQLWQDKENERALAAERKLAETTRLEKQLRAALHEAQDREAKLVEGELALQRRTESLQLEYDRRVDDVNEKSKRFRDNLAFKYKELQAQKKAVEDDRDRALREAADASKRVAKLEADFRAFREAQDHTPTAKLQVQIEKLTSSLADLDGRLQATETAKRHYRTQWIVALKEIARVRETSANRSTERVDAVEHELQALRVLALAREHMTEQHELDAIRSELSQLRQSDQAAQQMHQAQLAASVEASAAAASLAASKVQRLLDEREALMQTGLYSPEDRVIAQLDRAIAAAR